MTQKELYTAVELAEIFGISPRTLLFYKAKGLLKPAREDASRYSDRDRCRLETIIKGKHLGFTLQEIGKLLATAATDGKSGETRLRLDPEQVSERLRALETKRAALDTAIKELRQVLANRELASG